MKPATQLSLLSLLLLLYLLPGCGSAEAIKMYSYHTSKANLQKAVMKVIGSNPNIRVDDKTQRERDSSLLAHRKEWTATDSAEYADNLNAFIDVEIKAEGKESYYLVRYRGNQRHWEASPTSAIFISTARNAKGKALYQGQNEHGEFESDLANELTALFEKELILQVDKELGLQHTTNAND